MADFKTDESVATKTKHKIKRPSLYRVLLHNDDYTTMEFVVYVLELIFKKSSAEAMQIMLHVHNQGVGICGVYTYEIAETKVAEVHDLANQYEFPLKASLEEV
ncbi:ATP-dependent Clp protease adapter ClpS [Deltaproteobacteria bacterium TL4]